MDKFLVFMIGAVAMIVAIKYRKQIVDFTGKIDWLEQKLGPGGTYTGVIIMGMVVWLGSLMYALGTFGEVFGFFKRFF